MLYFLSDYTEGCHPPSKQRHKVKWPPGGSHLDRWHCFSSQNQSSRFDFVLREKELA